MNESNTHHIHCVEQLILMLLFFCCFCRHTSLLATRMDQPPKVPRYAGDSVVAGHSALRHGLRRYSFRTGRADSQRSSQFPGSASHLAPVSGSNPEPARVLPRRPPLAGTGALSPVVLSGGRSQCRRQQQCHRRLFHADGSDLGNYYYLFFKIKIIIAGRSWWSWLRKKKKMILTDCFFFWLV